MSPDRWRKPVIPRISKARRIVPRLRLFVGLAWIGGSVTCVPPGSFMQVKGPRPGHALHHRVAVVYSKHYQINMAGLERLHSFDIRKYAKVYLQLNIDGLIRPEDVFVPEAVTQADLLRVHTPSYLQSLSDANAVAGYLEAPVVGIAPALLIDAGVLQAFRYATGGTILAARLALKYGIAVNLGGGYHHARPDAGGGFCIYADMPIAIRILQAEDRIRQALIVDLDVHQGDGTAICLAGDDDVFTFSIHQEGIYPIPKAASDLDVELPARTDDATFLRTLGQYLPGVIDRSQPDIVFLQAGCDTLAGDPLAGFEMTSEGIVRRDAMVIDECVARRIPIVMTLGGGYSSGAWAAQYASVRRTIETYGLQDGRHHRPRRATAKERLYTK